MEIMSYKGAYIVYALVKYILRYYPAKVVSKTLIQRLLYIYSRLTNTDFHYLALQHGMYSRQVNDFIELANVLELITIDTVDGGTVISLAKYNADLQGLSTDEIDTIKKVAHDYANLPVSELKKVITDDYTNIKLISKGDD